MAPYYEYLCSGLENPSIKNSQSIQQRQQQQQQSIYFQKDEPLFRKMAEQNEKDLQALDARIKDAEENFGETEVREVLLARALFYVKIGDKEKALTAYRQTAEKTFPLGQRLDLAFARIRLGFAFDDHDLTSRNIEMAKTFVISPPLPALCSPEARSYSINL